nr:GntR family transcriptional regulator [uncultured Acidocella sp.]
MTKETATATAPQISGLSGVAPRASASGPLIRRLLSYLVTENLPAGSHLTEQGLADTLGVSRTPIRKALTELLAEGVVRKEAHRGYFLAKPAHDLFAASLDFDSVDEDTLFERIATDHLSGIIPDAFSERDVASHYGVSLRLAQRAIGNLSEENVIRQTEQGTWEFNPFLLTQEAYQASYTYRLAIEPQIPLLPSFSLRRDLIRSCRDEHLRLLSLPASERTGRVAFKVDAGFHETIATCGGNPFFLAGVVQHNRLRQLLEYRQMPDNERLLKWLQEHLDIMDALIGGTQQEASELMRIHLQNAKRLDFQRKT